MWREKPSHRNSFFPLYALHLKSMCMNYECKCKFYFSFLFLYFGLYAFFFLSLLFSSYSFSHFVLFSFDSFALFIPFFVLYNTLKECRKENFQWKLKWESITYLRLLQLNDDNAQSCHLQSEMIIIYDEKSEDASNHTVEKLKRRSKNSKCNLMLRRKSKIKKESESDRVRERRGRERDRKNVVRSKNRSQNGPTKTYKWNKMYDLWYERVPTLSLISNKINYAFLWLLLWHKWLLLKDSLSLVLLHFSLNCNSKTCQFDSIFVWYISFIDEANDEQSKLFSLLCLCLCLGVWKLLPFFIFITHAPNKYQQQWIKCVKFFVIAEECVIDRCGRFPCRHGGKCLPSDQGAICLCPLGFGGKRKKDILQFFFIWYR